MEVVIGQTVTQDFTTGNPLTGQVQDADVLPTCQVFEDTTDVPVLTPAVVQRVALVGNYRVTFTASAANGFEVGKAYNVVVQATVAGITAKARIGDFILETATATQAAHFTV